MSSATKKFSALLLKLKANFSWNSIRPWLAYLIGNPALVLGSLTSATGGFKAIPILVSFIPPTLFVTPSVVVTTLCVLSGISGFTCFYSGYAEPMTRFSYTIMDYLEYYLKKYGQDISNFFLYIQGKELNNKEIHFVKTKTPLEELKSKHAAKDHIKNDMLNNNKELCKRIYGDSLIFRLNNIDCKLNNYKKYLSDDEFNEFTEKLYKIHKVLYGKEKYSDVLDANQSATQSKENKNTLLKKVGRFILNTVINIITAFSMFLVGLGCLVVIGMGILTNQSLAIYAGFEVTNIITSICCLFAVAKQFCQFAQTYDKQHPVFLQFFGIIPNEKANIKSNIESLEHQVADQKSIEKVLNSINNILEIKKQHYNNKQDLKKDFKMFLQKRATILLLKNKHKLIDSEQDVLDEINTDKEELIKSMSAKLAI